jgi:hypothetical protein
MATWQEDAREFGRHVKAGGWRLGLLVARNVILGARSPVKDKVSAQEFAQVAGISPGTVALYLRGWEAAADVGLVPHADVMTPRAEPTLDINRLPAWQNFYASERQLAGRGGSVELHPDPEVMARRLAGKPDGGQQIARAVTSALPVEHKSALVTQLRQELPAPERPATPEPKPDRPLFFTVESVQRVIDDLDKLVADAERLPPQMTTHSRTLLSDSASRALPVVEWLSALLQAGERVQEHA